VTPRINQEQDQEQNQWWLVEEMTAKMNVGDSDKPSQVGDSETIRQQAEAVRRPYLDRLLAAVGERYSSATFDNYEIKHGTDQRLVVDRLLRYADELPARVSAGQSIVLFGSTGAGKDHLLVAMARVSIMRFGRNVVWRNGSSLNREFRVAMRSGGEDSLVAALVAPSVLYLSDPGGLSGERLTEFSAASLFAVIDGRYRAGRSTWVSVNVCTPRDAETKLTPPIADRLRDGSLQLWCDWPSWRQRDETA
jgi:DNA replication protein DnaC